jgi:hypothetical protein
LSNYLPPIKAIVFWNVDPLPALWFGIVLSTGVCLWVSRSPFDVLVILLISFIAWVAATQATITLQQSIIAQIHIEPPPDPMTSPLSRIVGPSNYLPGLCGIIGGFVGTTIILFGISAIYRSFRNLDGWSRTILIGSASGYLFECAFDPSTSIFHVNSFLPLFLVWQCGVAASLAATLTPQLRYEPPVLLKRSQASASATF